MSIPRIAWAAYGFALVVVILDQFTKALILGSVDVSHPDMIQPGRVFAEIIPGVLSFTMVRNTGVSFGLFGGGEARWFLTVFSILVAGALAWWAMKAQRRLLVTAIGLVIGGAIGNVIDRIRFGYVVDFIDFSATGLFPWVFNLADSAITVGVALLILDSVISERKPAVGAAPEKA